MTCHLAPPRQITGNYKIQNKNGRRFYRLSFSEIRLLKLGPIYLQLAKGNLQEKAWFEVARAGLFFSIIFLYLYVTLSFQKHSFTLNRLPLSYLLIDEIKIEDFLVCTYRKYVR